MRFLLDTHALIWAVDEPSRLSISATALLQDPANQIIVSAASIWEISIKFGLLKLALSLPYRQWMDKAIADLDAVILPITVDYADAQSRLPHHHGDPFDRMMVAQALTDLLSIVSADSKLDAYGIGRIW